MLPVPPSTTYTRPMGVSMYRRAGFAICRLSGADHRSWAAPSNRHPVCRASRLMITLALAVLAGSAPAATIAILQPLPMDAESPAFTADDAVSGTAPRAAEPYIRRVGRVRFDTDVFMPVSPRTGRRAPVSASFRSQSLGLAFFDDARFEVSVDATSRPQDAVLALRGRLANESVAAFTLTVTADGYLMTLHDLDGGLLYRVVGDTDTGTGRVTEVDVTKMPPVMDAAPMVPAAD